MRKQKPYPAVSSNLSHTTSSWVPRCRVAFSLVEMLVVLAILAVLAALLFPVVRKTFQYSRTTECLSNLKQIGSAVHLYTVDHNGCLPWGMTAGHTTVWTDALAPYLSGPSWPWRIPDGVLKCPSANGDDSRLIWSGYAMNDNPGYPDVIPDSWRRNWQEGWWDPSENQSGQFRLAAVTYPSSRYLVGDGFTWDVGVDDLPGTPSLSELNDNDFAAVNRHGEGRSNAVFFDGHAETLSPLEVYYSIKDPARGGE